jgi:hypothetical protein
MQLGILLLLGVTVLVTGLVSTSVAAAPDCANCIIAARHSVVGLEEFALDAGESPARADGPGIGAAMLEPGFLRSASLALPQGAGWQLISSIHIGGGVQADDGAQLDAPGFIGGEQPAFLPPPAREPAALSLFGAVVAVLLLRSRRRPFYDKAGWILSRRLDSPAAPDGADS